MEVKVIAVAGMPGSGKGELAMVAKELGLVVVSLGDVVRNHFRSTHSALSGDSIGAFADYERSMHGKGIWARRLLETIRSDLSKGPPLLLIDGLRSKAEADLLRETLGERFLVIAVRSSPEVRYTRLKERGRSDAPSDEKAFVERDRRELSWGLEDIIDGADITIANESDLISFKAEVRRTLLELGAQE